MRFCLKQVANFVLLATGGYELYSTTICTKPQSRLTKKSSVQFPETKCTSWTRNRILKYRDAMTIETMFSGEYRVKKGINYISQVVQRLDNTIHRINHYPMDKG